MRLSSRKYKHSLNPGYVALLLLLSALILAFNDGSVLASATLNPANSPQPPGSTVYFNGTGFNPGESISAWATAPSGKVIALRPTFAGSNGSFAYSLDTTGLVLGQWRLTAHGLSSGSEAIASFELASNPPSPPPSTPPTTGSNILPLPQGSLSVNPGSNYAGQIFQISGSGFAPNETLAIWETTPQGDASGLAPIKSDAQGHFAFAYKSHGPLAGIWAVTVHGLTSKVEKIGYFQLIYFVRGGAVRVELSRYHGTINDTLDVKGYNFGPNERFSYWVTAPDGVVYAGVQTPDNLNANPDGTIFFRYVLPAAKPGRWGFTLHGLFSNREAITYFTYDNP
jgi:hypothetical protein